MNKMQSVALAVASTLALSACGTLTDVNKEGAAAGDLVWPNVDDVRFDHRRGTFVDLVQVILLRPGVTRDAVYEAIGRPHFSEGFHVREWDYLFYLDTPGAGSDGVSTCQFKVLFDNDLIARNFYWHGVDGDCPNTSLAQYNLDADALFAFDRSSLADLNPQGRDDLDQLIVTLANVANVQQIIVTGHTDYLGAASYNQQLSQARAQTIRQYLIEHGVSSEKIVAYGAGEDAPVVSCEARASRADLIACLAPNRRVEILVEAGTK